MICRKSFAALTAALVMFPRLAAAAPEPGQSLADASIEQLMNVEVVSAGKKSQSLKTTAASVFVITAEDIRRSGMHSLPEVFRLAPGVQVARTVSGHWAISIRGFNGDFANKLLVLVDGRVVYNEDWGGVFWDMEEMPLQNIERIEIIRGPGAALWGANAVNGVINIVSKSAKDTQGGMVAAEVGDEDNNDSVRYGGKLGGNAYYRVTGRYGEFDALPPDAANPGGGVGSAHPWTSAAADFRVDWNPTPADSAFFTGRAYHSTIGEPSPFLTPSNLTAAPVDVAEHSLSGDLLGQWQHTFSNGTSLVGQLSWDEMQHGTATLPLSAHTIQSEIDYHFSLGSRNDMVWGVNYKAAAYDATPTTGHKFVPQDADLTFYYSYLEDQITLIPGKLFFIAGVNVGHNPFTGMEVQPTGRLLWTPNKKWTTWAAMSRAVRTPSLSEEGMNFNIAATPIQPGLMGLAVLYGNPNAGSESVIAWEAGQRVQFNSRLSLDLSTFFNRYQHILFFTSPPPFFVPPQGGVPPYLEIPITFGNDFQGQSYGGELSGAWGVTDRWRLTAGASLLQLHVQPYAGQAPPYTTINNSPVAQWDLRSAWDATKRLQLDVSLYYTGMIPQGGSPPLPVPRHLRGDLRVGWRLGEATEVSAGVQNAFDPDHAELPSLYQGQQLLVGRNIFGAFTWRF